MVETERYNTKFLTLSIGETGARAIADYPRRLPQEKSAEDIASAGMLPVFIQHSFNKRLRSTLVPYRK